MLNGKKLFVKYAKKYITIYLCIYIIIYAYNLWMVVTVTQMHLQGNCAGTVCIKAHKCLVTYVKSI